MHYGVLVHEGNEVTVEGEIMHEPNALSYPRPSLHCLTNPPLQYPVSRRINPEGERVCNSRTGSVNGKIQNNVIYRTSLLLLATPDVRSLRYLRATPAARKTDGDVATSRGTLDGVLHSISDGPSRFLSTVSIDQDSWPALDNIPQNSHNCILFHYTVVLTIVASI